MGESMPNLYELLSVEPDATEAQIKSAYRKAMKSAHPDAGGHPGLFRAVQHAYDVLADPEQRSEYDRQRSRPGTIGGQDKTSRGQGQQTHTGGEGNAEGAHSGSSHAAAHAAARQAARDKAAQAQAQAAEAAWREWSRALRQTQTYLWLCLGVLSFALHAAWQWYQSHWSVNVHILDTSTLWLARGIIWAFLPAAAIAWTLGGAALMRLPHGSVRELRRSAAWIAVACAPVMVLEWTWVAAGVGALTWAVWRRQRRRVRLRRELLKGVDYSA